jgi:hypothetical protein
MADIGTTNDLIVAHIIETTLGVTPANPAMARLRVAGESLGPNLTYDESADINPNYSLADLILTGMEAGGSIPFDFAKSVGFDDILQAVLRGTWTAGVLKGGTVKRSYTIEKKLVGASVARYMKFLGARYNGFTLEGSVGSRITGTVDVMALSAVTGLTSVVGTGSITEPADNRIMSMVDMTAFSMTGDTTPLIVNRFTLGVSNNIRRAAGHGQLAAYDLPYGLREVTLSADVYFETWEQMDKFLNRANNNLTMTLTDGTNTYTFRLPRLRYRSLDVSAGGGNADLMQTIEGRALYDPTVGTVTDIQVTRIPA